MTDRFQKIYEHVQNDLIQAKVRILTDYLYDECEPEQIVNIWENYCLTVGEPTKILHLMREFNAWTKDLSPIELLRKVDNEFCTYDDYFTYNGSYQSIDNPFQVIDINALSLYMVEKHDTLNGNDEIQAIIDLF